MMECQHQIYPEVKIENFKDDQQQENSLFVETGILQETLNEKNLAARNEDFVKEEPHYHSDEEFSDIDAMEAHIPPATLCEEKHGVSGHLRRRSRHEDKWKSVQCKRRRNSGRAYTSRTTNQPVAARVIGPACKCGCFEKLGMHKVKAIFEAFWEMGDFGKQNDYVAKLVSCQEVKRCRVKDRRSRTLRRILYTVWCDSDVHTVCPRAFYSIHGITERRVRTVLYKETGTTQVDKRGKLPSPFKVTDERKQTVHDHINSVSQVPGHCSKAKKSLNSKYLPNGLNVSTLYNLYLEWMRECRVDMEPVSHNCYREVFNKAFNIGFESPKSDACNYCDKINIELRIVSEASARIEQLKTEKLTHEAHAEVAQNILKSYKDNQDKSVGAICIALQQALPTPKLTHGVQYYKQKLSTFNFGVHNIKSGMSSMYVWNESVARQGSSEIASCINHYIANSLDRTVTSLVVFSDNCAEQNKNINIVLAYLHKIHEGRFNKIEHYFMVPGHSHLPCGRDFRNIETKIKDTEIYSTDHYISLIRKTKTRRPFNVVPMNRSLFLNFNALQGEITKRHTLGTTFKYGKVFIVSDTYKQGFAIKATYDAVPVQVKLHKGNHYDSRLFDLSRKAIPQKYTKAVQLSANKVKDLKELLTYVPTHFKQFFVDLLVLQESSSNTETAKQEELSDDDVLED